MENEIEPAVKGVHWRKLLNSSGRSRLFCLKCDPKSTSEGYCNISALNRHLRKEHKKRAFTTPSKRQRVRGSPGGRQTSGKRAATASIGRRSTPARKAKEGATKKHPEVDKEPNVAANRRPVDDEADTDSNPTQPEPDKQHVGEGAMEDAEDLVRDVFETPALLQPDHYISIPICGLYSIVFKSESTAGTTSQTLEAKWFESAQSEIGKCCAKEFNLNEDGHRKGKTKAPLANSIAHANAACIEKLSGGPCALFPIWRCESKAMAAGIPTKSPPGTSPGKEDDLMSRETEEILEDALQWALRPMDKLKRGDGQVPLVNYSDDSDGLD